MIFQSKTHIQEEINNAKIHVTPFFKFCRVKVTKQQVDVKNKIVTIKVKPNGRYTPICHSCGRPIKRYMPIMI